MHDVAPIRAVVHRALDLGITLFDTADAYGQDGKSEEFLGEILGARRKDVVIATKFGVDAPVTLRDKRSCKPSEASLNRLRTDWIDLYQVHFPDRRTPIEETLRALDDLVRQGKVRAIGCSNFSASEVAAAQATSQRLGLAAFATCQDEYSLLARNIERDLVPPMQQHGMTLLPYRPVASGLLTGKYQRGKASPKNARLSYSQRTRLRDHQRSQLADRRALASHRGGHRPQHAGARVWLAAGKTIRRQRDRGRHHARADRAECPGWPNHFVGRRNCGARPHHAIVCASWLRGAHW